MVALFLPQEMLIRVFLGWLRGEPLHCKMVAIPTLDEEDALRPSGERERLVGETHRDHKPHQGALAARPQFRFHTPLIERGVRISRTPLSDKTSRLSMCIRKK